MKRRLIKNAIANVGRGGTAAIVALVLPPVLIRHMEPATYAVWVLVLQVTAYMGFLDFGLQTAVGRYIALSEEQKDSTARDTFFSTALAGLSLASVIGIAVIVLVSIFTPQIFPGIPRQVLPSMRGAILIAGISTALGLPASAWNGIFVGLQRYEIPAISIALGRLLSSLGLIWAALTGRSLVVMACIVASANILVYASQYAILGKMAPDVSFRKVLITKDAVKELTGYCLSLTVWSFSTLLITGFDLLLVGRFEFKAVAVYSAAAVLISFLGGLQTSVFNVIMPHSATLHAAGNASALGALLLRATKLGTILLLLTGLPLIVYSFSIIQMWLGSQYAEEGAVLLKVLVVGNMIRLLGVPYASILVGTGQQRLIMLSPLMEGLSNLAASIVLGIKFGAAGIAWGTLAGAILGMLANFVYSIPRTRKWIDLSPWRLLSQVCLVSGLCVLPLFLVFPITLMHIKYAPVVWGTGLLMSLIVCGTLAMKVTAWRWSSLCSKR